MANLNINDLIANHVIDNCIVHAKDCKKCQDELQIFLTRIFDCKELRVYYDKILKGKD